MTKKYECLVMFPSDVTEDAKKLQEKGFDDIVQKFKGTISQKVDMGKRQLGYLIKKRSEAQFFVYHLEMAPDKVLDFRKAMQLNGDILKYTLTVAVEVVEKSHPPKTKTTRPRAPRAPRKTESSTRVAVKEG